MLFLHIPRTDYNVGLVKMQIVSSYDVFDTKAHFVLSLPIPRAGYLKRKLLKIPGTLSHDDHKGKINFVISLPIPRNDHVKRRFSYDGAHLWISLPVHGNT